MKFMILSICDKSYLVQVILLVKTLFRLVCILAPIIIIITGCIGLAKVIKTGSEDDAKEYFKVFVRKIIAGLVIMFIPLLMNTALNQFVSNNNVEFLTCFDKASIELVNSLKAREEQAEKDKLKQQEKSDEQMQKEAYQKEQQEKQKQKKIYEEEKKKEEEERRRKEEEARQRQRDQNVNGSIIPVSVGENGVSVKQYNNLKFYEIVPDNITPGLPLIIFLHGAGEVNSVSGVGNLPIVSYVANTWDRNSKPFIFIAPVAPSHGWGNYLGTVKGLIDSVVNEYDIDRNHIIVTGMSMGGYGTWQIVSQYGSFFSAAVPMSGCSSGYDPSKFVGVPIYAMVGGQETDTAQCMKNLVNNINSKGGNAQIDVVPGASHGTIQRYYRDEALFNWMLSQ